MCDETIELASERRDAPARDLDARLESLENKVSELKKKPKDGWDILQIVAAALVPIAIAVVGTVFSINSKEAEVAVAETNARVAQAELVHSFMEALTTGNPQQRKIAVAAVMLALPEDAESLVRLVKESDPDAGVRAFAGRQLGVSDLYAQLVFGFNSYEGRSVPPGILFSEGGELTIGLSSASVDLDWQSALPADRFDTTVSSSIQTATRHSQPTVDGVTVRQTNTFERFAGELGDYATADAWGYATVFAVFRINARDEWLRTDEARMNRVSMDDFAEFYDIEPSIIKEWSESDYEVTPFRPVRLEVYLGESELVALEGFIARVWEHDEDVRNLYVAFFSRRGS